MTPAAYTIQVESAPMGTAPLQEQAALQETTSYLWAQLAAYNSRWVSQTYHQLVIVARDSSGAIAGGLIGVISNWEWLHIDLLWIREELRGQGIGSALLAAAETEGVRAGCRHAHVDSMDFQAPAFYRKHGYTEYAVLPDHPRGHTRHFFRKQIAVE